MTTNDFKPSVNGFEFDMTPQGDSITVVVSCVLSDMCCISIYIE